MPLPIRVQSTADFEQALVVRYAVFCDEQGIAREIERDAADSDAAHVLLRDSEGEPVATGRVLRQRADGTLVALQAAAKPTDVARIGRMAVLRRERRSGLGAQIIGALEQLATEAGLREAELHAQLRAAPFYAACGYTARGAEYEEEGIPHVSMVKRLAP